jgi:tRNA A-37 threonylcarbamoyl transferase component Bud32
MEKGLEELAELGILLYGSRRDEYVKEIPILLRRQLPPKWEWVDSSSNSIVAKRLQPCPAYYKEFLSRSPFEKIKTLLRGSRCQRAIIRGELLRQRGFHSPATYCWGKKSGRYFMVTEGLNAVSLSTYIEKNWVSPLLGRELRAKRDLIEELGKEIGKLHKAGIYHGDLRISNVLVEETGQDIIFHFIDNERNLFFKKIPSRLVVKNLVQVNMIFLPVVSRQDRLRFFHVYSETYDRFNSGEKRDLIIRVHERTKWRVARKLAKDKGAERGKI